MQSMTRQCVDNDVAIFGDSRARVGINPNGLGIPALNLAEGGYNPAVDFYRARDLLTCAHRPRLVILSYSVLLYKLFAPFLLNEAYIDRLLTDHQIQEIVTAIKVNHD